MKLRKFQNFYMFRTDLKDRVVRCCTIKSVFYLRKAGLILKSFLKSIPVFVALKKLISSLFDFSFLNILSTFKAYVPNSAGTYRAKARQTIESINRFPLAMTEYLESHGGQRIYSQSIFDFLQSRPEVSQPGVLGDLFVQYGSDKSTFHNYDLVYERILGDPNQVTAILEIGLGTNNPKIISTMGFAGKPGASLRAFKSYFSNATIFGADVDREILFCEERIQTFFVDQLCSQTFLELARYLPSDFDLIIDDGLHSVDANMRTLNFALPLLKIGGWLVIEDIGENSLELWKFIAMTLPKKFSPILVLAENGALFLVQRL